MAVMMAPTVVMASVPAIVTAAAPTVVMAPPVSMSMAAARKLGLIEAPVVALRGLTEVQRRQLVLADNRIALNASWDAEMLSLELADLSGIGADLSTLGFTTKELARASYRFWPGLCERTLPNRL
ncbi:hypothetical protein [Bradyrhizobium oropedii]|uniref:hypothetical protein n=1 Tax=Bradyrhizobium oropedii TaxID=1571201 RepID=UPI001E4CB415|nr:hypothetical protein [Bradyrhizobium oropedii]